ncbi:MAG TPA: GAF domain-containing protein [Longimicrobiaceae bacterium]|nr:GAF domain-containing protein [Longimicrobiaceae bacterium]
MEPDVARALRDPGRVEAVRRTGLLDTPPEACFDRVTRLVTYMLDVPLALINLLDGERQYSKSCLAPPSWPAGRNAELKDAYCSHVVGSHGVVAIEDTRRDPRTATSRFTTELGLRAYLGVPLTDGGHVIGTLCAADLKPRRWTGEQTSALRDLAELAATEIGLRAQVRETERADRLFQTAEAARREKTALLESVSEGIYGTDAVGRCTFLNPAGAALLGYAPEEVLGADMHQRIHHTRADGSPYPLSECPLQGVYGDGGSVRVRDELLWRKDGTSFLAEFAASPIRDGDRVTGAVVTFRDVTARRREEGAQRFLSRASELLTASSVDYRATLQSLVRLSAPALGDWCGVYVLTGGGAIERVEVAHGRPGLEGVAEQLKRYPVKLHPSHPVVRALRTGEPHLLPEVPDELLDEISHDEEHRRVLGTLRLRSSVAAPLIARHRTLGALWVTTSGQRRLGAEDLELCQEFARRAALAVDNARLLLEAQEASRAKSEFLATISHELRTPLNAVTGYAELMRAGIPEPLPARSCEYVERIRRSATHLLRLVEEVLTFSRLEARRETVQVRPVSVPDLVAEVSAIVEPLALDRGLRYLTRVPDEPIPLATDPHRLRQVLLNLLDNAVKFTERGEVELAVSRAGDAVEFTVRDTGIGIAPEDEERIFEPFRQLDQSATRTAGGTGLGLTVAQRLTGLLGGTLSLRSAPGAGTRFTVRLPARPAPRSGAEEGR